MKTIKLLIFTALVALTVSCSKNNDDGDQQDTSANIVGTWNATAVNYTGSTTTEIVGISITQDFVGTGYDIDYTFTFAENPNEASALGSYSVEIVTTVQGQSNTQNVTNLSFDNTGIWSRNGNEVTMDDAGDISTATIVELTETTLILNIVETETQTANGGTITTTVDSNFNFTR